MTWILFLIVSGTGMQSTERIFHDLGRCLQAAAELDAGHAAAIAEIDEAAWLASELDRYEGSTPLAWLMINDRAISKDLPVDAAEREAVEAEAARQGIDTVETRFSHEHVEKVEKAISASPTRRALIKVSLERLDRIARFQEQGVEVPSIDDTTRSARHACLPMSP